MQPNYLAKPSAVRRVWEKWPALHKPRIQIWNLHLQGSSWTTPLWRIWLQLWCKFTTKVLDVWCLTWAICWWRGNDCRNDFHYIIDVSHRFGFTWERKKKVPAILGFQPKRHSWVGFVYLLLMEKTSVFANPCEDTFLLGQLARALTFLIPVPSHFDTRVLTAVAVVFGE